MSGQGNKDRQKSKQVNPVPLDKFVIYAPKDLILALQDGMYTLESMFVEKVAIQAKFSKSDKHVLKTLKQMQKMVVKYSYR